MISKPIRMVIPSIFILVMLSMVTLALNDDFGSLRHTTLDNHDIHRSITNPYVISHVLDTASGDVTGNGRADMVWLRVNPSTNVQSIILANYSEGNINVISSFTVPGNIIFSEIVLADMTDDGKQNIMFAGATTNTLYFSALEYDGTDLVQINSSYTGQKSVAGASGMAHLICDYDNTNRCAVVTGTNAITLTLVDAHGIVLNSTTSASVVYWLSKWNPLHYTDIDLDGNYEIVFLTGKWSTGIKIADFWAYSVNPTSDVINIKTAVGTTLGGMFGDSSTHRQYYSNSLTHNYLPTQDGSKKETVMYYTHSTGALCLITVSYTGTLVSNLCYSALSFTGFSINALKNEGLLSNTINLEITGDGQLTPCVMKYNADYDDDGVDDDNFLICINPRNERVYIFKIYYGLPNTNTALLTPMNFGDTIEHYGNYNIADRNIKIFTADLIYKTSFYTHTDIVTPFGIGIIVNQEPGFALYNEDWNSIVSMVSPPYIDSGYLPGMHPYHNTNADIIIMGRNNVWVLDDEYENEEPTIKWAEFNPGIDGLPIQVNESGYISLILEDAESDPVSARIIMYEGTLHEYHTDWVANVSPGIRLNFYVDYNTTISNGKIIIEYTDDQEPHVLTQRTEYFSVATTGIVYNEYKSYIGSDFEDADDETTASDDNAVINALTELDSIFNLNLGTSVLWMILISVVAGLLWVKGAGTNPIVSLGIISFVSLFLLIIGVTLGFISAWLIVLIMVLAIAIISLTFMGWFRGA